MTETTPELLPQSVAPLLSTPPLQGQGNTTARAVAEAFFRHRTPMLATVPWVAGSRYSEGYQSPPTPRRDPVPEPPRGGDGPSGDDLHGFGEPNLAFAAPRIPFFSSDLFQPQSLPHTPWQTVLPPLPPTQLAQPNLPPQVLASSSLTDHSAQNTKEIPMLGFLKGKSTPAPLASKPSSAPAAEAVAKPADLLEPREPMAYFSSPPRPAGVPRNSFAEVPGQNVSRLQPLIAPIAPEPVVLEPMGHPDGRPRPHSAARPIFSLIPDVPAPAKVVVMPAPEAAPAPRPAAPVFIPEARSPQAGPQSVSESEPRHRVSRLAAVRDEILGNRSRLSPSQRAQRSRPTTTRDRNGRLAYITYTVDGGVEHTQQDSTEHRA